MTFYRDTLQVSRFGLAVGFAAPDGINFSSIENVARCLHVGIDLVNPSLHPSPAAHHRHKCIDKAW